MFFLLLRLHDMTQTAHSRDGPSYKSHPLYQLRRAILLTAAIGFLLNIFVILSLLYGNNQEQVGFVLLSMLLLVASFAFSLHDLITYGTENTTASQAPRQNSNSQSSSRRSLRTPEAQEWPSKRILVIDILLAIALQWFFWCSFFAIISSWDPYRYRRSGSETLEAYANLANFVASIEHAIAFWKELLARKKSAWKRDIEARPCPNCGHVDHAATSNCTEHSPPPPDAESFESSLLGKFGKGKITLPKWASGPDAIRYKKRSDPDLENDGADATAHDPLLVTPDGSTTEIGGPSGSGYGTLDESVESIPSVPETIVKKKDKGKKRQVEVE